jgi:hypothetical protein|tara:strand:- start:117 stop:299 length:183 start_codon:yes stop_codon:yes gene_type:complete
MGLFDKIKNQQKLEIPKNTDNFTEDELKYLLTLIAHSEFKGIDLQIIYNITAKIQNKLIR